MTLAFCFLFFNSVAIVYRLYLDYQQNSIYYL